MSFVQSDATGSGEGDLRASLASVANFFWGAQAVGFLQAKKSARPSMASPTAENSAQMRRRFCGRQPLCGTGVTSEMLVILKPTAFNARTADSRPGPGPLMRTSRFFTPHSCAARPACSAATWAANGVDLREPLKPIVPADDQAMVLPCASVMVMVVLLNDELTCAMRSEERRVGKECV